MFVPNEVVIATWAVGCAGRIAVATAPNSPLITA